MIDFYTFTRMFEIWANYLLPKALKSGPKSNKLPNLVTLMMMPTKVYTLMPTAEIKKQKKLCLDFDDVIRMPIENFPIKSKYINIILKRLL